MKSYDELLRENDEFKRAAMQRDDLLAWAVPVAIIIILLLLFH